MKRIISSTLFMICISTLLIGCSRNSDIANVTVTKVKTSNSISDTTYTGNVTSAEKVSIIPSVSGKVQTVDVEVGQTVEKDAQLFTIDNTELTYKLNQAQANYDAAAAAYDKTAGGSAKQTQNDAATALEKAQNELKDAQSQYENNTAVTAAQTAYNDAKANYERTSSLYEADAATKVTLDDAKSKLDTASAALEIAKSNAETRYNNAKASFAAASENASITNAIINPDNIASAKAQMDSAQAALDIAKHQLDNATITAPIAGKISAKNISVGELTPTQTPSLILENANSVNVIIKVTETNINDIYIGMAAKISVPSTGLSYDGTISTISPSADQKTGMFDVQVDINGSDDNLKLGMVTNVTLVNSNEDDTLLVPKESVFEEDGTSYVYVLNSNILAKHTVTVGASKNQYVEIKYGISANDQIVVEGSSNIKDNGKFNIVKSN
ncbi:efflux RND transporter periplasmic adaptor subunit [Clostridium beijerinckii]|nr:efflux RND transporter periplasmic adaptor subunit [Clostridium beijerinckii]